MVEFKGHEPIVVKPGERVEFPMFEKFGEVAFTLGVDLMTPNEQRELAGLPPLNVIKNNDVPKAVKCPICGGNISQNDTKCKYCDTPLLWKGSD